MPNQFRIESIEKPTRYWSRKLQWVAAVGAASLYDEAERLIFPVIPPHGCWVPNRP